MRYSVIAGLLIALSGFVAAYPADDAVFKKLESRCLAAGNLCDPDSAGQCCGSCCAFCSVPEVVEGDDDAELTKRGFPFCSYFCGASC